MEHEQVEKAVARNSALIYIPVSLGAAFLFIGVSSLLGGYPPLARFGGAVWVALLTLIISMPVVTSRVKKVWRDNTRITRDP